MLGQSLSVAQLSEGVRRDRLDRQAEEEERRYQRNKDIQTIRNAADAARIKREQKLEDDKNQRIYEIQKAALLEQWKKAKTPLEIREIESRIAENDSQRIKNLSEANKEKIKTNIKIGESLDLDKRSKEEMQKIVSGYYVSGKEEIGLPWQERKNKMNQANNRANNPIYYRMVKEEVPGEEGLIWDEEDVPGVIEPIPLPRNPRTGKQITSQEIIDTAKANGMSPEELLIHWGIIQPKGSE